MTTNVGFSGNEELTLKIETIFLDAGGVLVWPNWKRVAEALRAHGVDVDPQKLRDADPLARYSLDRADLVGRTTDQRRSNSLFDLVLIEAGVEPSDRTAAAIAEMHEYHRQHNLWEIVPDFVFQTLGQLRAAGYKMAVVSNANGTLSRAFPRLGLAGYFDVVLDSAVEGVEKPDRRYFELALSRMHAAPDTTVHVGDFYNIDVVGARDAGLHAILIDERDLYRDAACPRIRSIEELPALIGSLTAG
jgi:putative hydrolase of the HAD superfamily